MLPHGMSQLLERILEEVRKLSEAEQRQLAAILPAMKGEGNSSSAERDFEAKLAAEGWLSLPVPPLSDLPPFQIFPPLRVQGQPLSEILIEDRR